MRTHRTCEVVVSDPSSTPAFRRCRRAASSLASANRRVCAQRRVQVDVLARAGLADRLRWHEPEEVTR